LQFPPNPAALLKEYHPDLNCLGTLFRLAEMFAPLMIAAMHQGNYATIPNYLERELRYMDAGERGPKAPKLGHKGIPGYQ
jgi:hypothetical protein